MDAIPRLARFAADLTWGTIPPEVAAVARDCLIDTLGVALAGSRRPVVERLSAVARQSYAAGPAHLWGGQGGLSAPGAALVNGAAAHALDFDDNCYDGFVHGSAVIVPAAIAAAEAAEAAGADLLVAFVAGCEAEFAVGAAATIFFAYVGFDAVSTAAEETKNPQVNVPIGLIGSLGICTVFYILVAAGAVGTIGGQPILGPNGIPFPAGSEELARQCALPQYADMLVCSNEALAHVLREIGFSAVGNMLGIAAFVALPSVILILLFGQTRIFFVMARDGLLPEGLSKIHPKWKTPYVVTAITGGIVAFAAAFLPVGQLADIANAGTLYAFMMVAIAVMMLRKTDPNRERLFRTPMLWLVGPATIAGCIFLFLNLPLEAMLVLPAWGAIGLVIYYLYGYKASHLGKGIIEIPEDDPGVVSH
ncbi:MAG: amino acid permease [Blastomonas sp.]|nr:amino acid permease [Blastomonas sp.]